MRLLYPMLAAFAALATILAVCGCGKTPPPEPPPPAPSATAPGGVVDEANDDPSVFSDDPKRMRKMGHESAGPGGDL